MFKSDDFINFELYALVPNGLTGVKLVYTLNQKLDCNFKRVQDLDLVKNKQSFYFSCFEWVHHNTDSVYHLIVNQSHPLKAEPSNQLLSLFDRSIFLIPERKKYNYLLRIESSYPQQEFLDILLTKGFQFVHLPLKTIKSKNNLIF